MDFFTQMLLGATLGIALTGYKNGYWPMLAGAVVGAMPDLVSFLNFGNAINRYSAWQGWSHSIFFALLVSVLLGNLFARTKWGSLHHWHIWSLIAFIILMAHIFLDVLTASGATLFWPLSNQLTSYPLIQFDLLFTGALSAGLVALAWFGRDSKKPFIFSRFGLGLAAICLSWNLSARERVQYISEHSLAKKNASVHVYPTPFNSLVWRVLVKNPQNYSLGYYSILDGSRKVTFIEPGFDSNLNKQLLSLSKVQKLKRLTNNLIDFDVRDQKIYMTDLRNGMQYEIGKFQEGKLVENTKYLKKSKAMPFSLVLSRIIDPHALDEFLRKKQEMGETQDLKKGREGLIY